MSDAYKCDVCDKYDELPPASSLKANNSAKNGPVMGHGHIKNGTYDLCRDCAETFIYWVENEN